MINFPCTNCGHMFKDHNIEMGLINDEDFCKVCDKNDMWDRTTGRFRSFHKYIPDNLLYLEQLSEKTL